MNKKIFDIYNEYKIMPNLQMHMLRVAAVASLVCDDFPGTLNKDDIVTACLLHDMGNIVKFKLSHFPELNEPEGIEYWEGVQDEFREKYGTDDHKANYKIGQELGVSERILELINSISFLGAEENALSEDIERKIVDYSDNRVDPFGVVSLKDRFIDLRKRYAQHTPDSPERQVYEESLKKIEEEIFSKCKMKPEYINNNTVEPLFSTLQDFVIK